ncbi:MAG: diaminopimelate decarboxylase [Deltaproteobacteria bacterium]|nr:diaminopimelate decarboxylase [Deltaproteobacteria bacterium]
MHLSNKLLLDLAKTYSTPLYVYNGDLIKQRYQELYKFIAYPKLQIYYAMKANYNPAILKLLLGLGARIDTVSPAECLFCLKLGFQPEQMLFTANSFTDHDMQLVHDKGILFNIGSLSELNRYGQNFPGSRICLRFNPAVVAGAHEKIMTGGDLTQFGILLEDLEQAKELVKKHQLHVVGLHEHTGSGIKEMEKYLQAMSNTLALARKENFPELEFVDFGGGFGVSYHPNEERIDYLGFGKTATAMFNSTCQTFGRELSFFFEPGKYLVAEAGYLLVQINTLKNNKGRLIAGCNSGFPQLIRPMFYDAYHHIENLSNPQGTEKVYDVCGNICETGDRFATNRALAEIREGDILSIQNAGAYCYAMGGIYNMRPMPTEIIVIDGQAKLARKALNHEQLAQSILNECSL